MPKQLALVPENTNWSVCDVQLAGDKTVGRLVKWLRILGISVIDFWASRARDIPWGLMLLTRKRALGSSPWALVLPSEDLDEQLRFVFTALPTLKEKIAPFSRCIRCNALLEEIPREEVFGQVPDYVYETQRQFRRCPRCGRIYWSGTHKGRMQARLAALGLFPQVGG